ncbi:MAG: flagellar assembly protein FliH [Comamonas sp.]|nr:flagellar assembly protein FliH [Comamonas sp.]
MTGENKGSNARSPSRFIPSEELNQEDIRAWHFTDVTLVPRGIDPYAAPGRGQVFQTFEEHEAAAQKALKQQMEAERLAQERAYAAQQAAAAQEQELASAQQQTGSGMDEQALQELLEQTRQEAFNEGLEQGQEQGQEQTHKEWQEHFAEFQQNQGQEVAQRLAQVVQQAQGGIAQLQQQVAPDLLQLACDIARQVVRQELRTNPQALMPVVREALDMLGAETKPAVVRLHPADWQVLESHLRAAMPNPKIEWLADASVQPGDCLVQSQGAQVDGSLEKRWQRAVAALGLVSTWYEGAASHE